MRNIPPGLKGGLKDGDTVAGVNFLVINDEFRHNTTHSETR